MLDLLFLLLPLAAASGWYAAKRHYHNESKLTNNQFPKSYLIGLNYLLNEQPDKAVDVFVKMLEVDTETVETHLALGVLFRRRGEVDRAIRIHQNLIARPQLPKKHYLEAVLALGQDYLRVGWLDRAERLFLQIIESDNESVADALFYLLDIYQQQKRWDIAINTANKLLAYDAKIKSHIAHYYCELAVEAEKQQQYSVALRYTKQALAIDPNCTRANMLKGDIEFHLGNYKYALEDYKNIKDQDDNYLFEVLPKIIICFEKLDKQQVLIEFLHSCLAEYPRTSIAIALANHIKLQQDHIAAINFMIKQLQQRPSLRGLQYLIELQLAVTQTDAQANLLVLHEVLIRLLKNKPVYRCIQCGFSSRIIHWLCPSCKHWNTVRPIQGLEGD